MKRETINIFDFDNTIYDGDASLGFYFYCLKNNIALLKYLPYQVWHMGLFVLNMQDRREFKQHFFIFLKSLKDTGKVVDSFWAAKSSKIKVWYTARSHKEDVIISASPEFLLQPIAKKLGVKELIGTRMDSRTGHISGANCRGEEKVRRLRGMLNDFDVESCYSDSLSDLPILHLAKKPYIVKKNTIIELDHYKPSKLSGIFLKKNFLAFIVVGGFNALDGIILATLMSLFIASGTLAFVVGYFLSLIISYFLNSLITFGDRNFSVKTFIKFCISYIPNFLIQVICVSVLIDIASIDKILAYTISVIIGVPVTFLILSVFAFRKKEQQE